MSVPKEPVGRWRKSSFSGTENQCVEVALEATRIGIRDSKAPDEGEFWLPRASFEALQDAVAPDRKKRG